MHERKQNESTVQGLSYHQPKKPHKSHKRWILYTKKTTVNNLQINEDPIKIRTSRLVGLCHRASNGLIET